MMKKNVSVIALMVLACAAVSVAAEITTRSAPKKKTDTALVIIDMQNDVKQLIPAAGSVVEPVKKAIAVSRKNGMPVIYILRVHRPDGSDVERSRLDKFNVFPYLVEGTKGAEVIDELKPEKDDHIIRKHRFDGFFETDMQMILVRLGVAKLVVCGVQTPACVRTTVISALERDYDVAVLSDATAAATPEIHKANLSDMRDLGARIMTVDEFSR